MRQKHCKNHGFTLIELSIVLVIIGLLVGGVLVGKDLISAAGTRATIAQIEKYNTAANTFVTKYGYIPGDIPDPYASQFGFQARGQYAGEGDGNGVIEGIFADAPASNAGDRELAGETAMFWVDLSSAHLMDGSFGTATTHVIPSNVTGSSVGLYLPSAKLGNGNFIYVWSMGSWSGVWTNTGQNYFGVISVTSLSGAGSPSLAGTMGLTVQQAYNMDKKIDDGYPQTGRVIAEYISVGLTWAGVSPGTAVMGSSTTCYDNGGNASAPMQYSTETYNGTGLNCTLSFQMQGAAR